MAHTEFKFSESEWQHVSSILDDVVEYNYKNSNEVAIESIERIVSEHDGWIDVNEAKPPLSSRIIVHKRNGLVCEMYCNHNGSILYAGGLQQTDQVTLGNHFQKHLNNPQNDR